MPGARNVWVVATKFTPVAIVPKPAMMTPMTATATLLFENAVE